MLSKGYQDRSQSPSRVTSMLDIEGNGKSDPRPFSVAFISQWVEALRDSIDHHKRSSRWHRRQMRSAADRLSRVLEDCERLGIEIEPPKT